MSGRGKLVRWLLPLVAVALGGLGYHHVFSWSRPLEPLDPPATPAAASWAEVVAGTGVVEAGSENIRIGAALPGVVLEVYVPVEQVGRFVTAGTPLLRVDDRHLRAQLEVARGRLADAQARLARLEQLPRAEEVPPSEARVAAAEARVRLADDALARARRLVEVRSLAEEEYVARSEQLQIARQQLAEAEAQHRLLMAGAWESDLAVARAELAAASAEVGRLDTEIERAIVRAPVDAQVLEVDVRPGEYVEPAARAPLMVLGDTRRLQVRVDVDEHDIARLRPGAAGEALIRGGAGQRIALEFVRVEPYVVPKAWLTGENTERIDTRVLQVVYRVASEQPRASGALALEDAAHPVPESDALNGSAAGLLYVGQQLDVFLEAAPAELAAR